MQETDATIITSLPLRKGRRGGMAQLVDLVVDGGVLLDVGVGGGDVGFGLVVVVVGDKILHRVIREELLELAVKLGASVLLWAMISVGLFNAWMTLAMVKVLPEPVTPSKVWN